LQKLGIAAFAFGASLVGISCAAFAAEIKATSKVDAAIVYSKGAEVTRLAKVHLDAGDHTIILNDLPANLVPSSIRLEGRSSARLDIGPIDSRAVAIEAELSPATVTARKQIERDIQKLGDEQTLLGSALEAAKVQREVIAQLIQLPGHKSDPAPQSAAQPGTQPDWAQLLNLVGERTEKAQRSILELGLKSRDIDRSIADLNDKLQALAPAAVRNQTEVKVAVTALTAQDAELLVRYQIADASWTPFYDARLDTGSADKAPRLEIVRRATVRQQTGEDWSGIALSLSTAPVDAKTAAPDLAMLQVNYQSEAEYQAAKNAMRPRGEAPLRGHLSQAQDTKSEAEVRSQSAEVLVQPFQSLFTVTGRVSVAGNNDNKHVHIADDTIAPQLLVRAVPRLDETAYLYAKLIMPKDAATLIPGPVTLYRDGAQVGTGQLPLLVAGELHELGFGADDKVKVDRVIVEDQKGESGIFVTSQVQDHNYRITVTNLHGTPVQVRLLDRMPVSAHADIKVDPKFNLEPSRRDIDGRLGTMVWELPMLAQGTRVVAFGYRITAPAGQRIAYNEVNYGALDPLTAGMMIGF
jgi:uncharacterized protein (TIGR02231 family)